MGPSAPGIRPRLWLALQRVMQAISLVEFYFLLSIRMTLKKCTWCSEAWHTLKPFLKWLIESSEDGTFSHRNIIALTSRLL